MEADKNALKNLNTQVDDIQQDPYVYHTVTVIETYVQALDQFLRVHCVARTKAKQLTDCGPQSEQKFNVILNEIFKWQHQPDRSNLG